jgi:hypothetical protein
MKLAKNFCIAALLSLGVAAPVLAECAYPTKPAAAPNGAQATQEEMVAAMKASRQFDTDVKTYQTCLTAETEAMISALGDKPSDEQIKAIKAKQDVKFTAAYDDATKVAADFNVQLRAFKAK